MTLSRAPSSLPSVLSVKTDVITDKSTATSSLSLASAPISSPTSAPVSTADSEVDLASAAHIKSNVQAATATSAAATVTTISSSLGSVQTSGSPASTLEVPRPLRSSTATAPLYVPQEVVVAHIPNSRERAATLAPYTNTPAIGTVGATVVENRGTKVQAAGDVETNAAFSSAFSTTQSSSSLDVEHCVIVYANEASRLTKLRPQMMRHNLDNALSKSEAKLGGTQAVAAVEAAELQDDALAKEQDVADAETVIDQNQKADQGDKAAQASLKLEQGSALVGFEGASVTVGTLPPEQTLKQATTEQALRQSTTAGQQLLQQAVGYQSSLPQEHLPYCEDFYPEIVGFLEQDLPAPLLMWLCVRLQRAGYGLSPQYYERLAELWNKHVDNGPSLQPGMEIFGRLQFQETLLTLGGPGFHAYALQQGLLSDWQIDDQGYFSSDKLFEYGGSPWQYSVMCKYRWQSPDFARRLFLNYRTCMSDTGIVEAIKTFKIHLSFLDETILFELLHSDIPECRSVVLSVLRGIAHSAYSIACTRVIKLCLGYNVRLHKWLMPERFEMRGFKQLGLDFPVTRSIQDQAWLRCEVMRGMSWADLMQLTQTQEPREAIMRLQDFAQQTGLEVWHIENMLAERIAVDQDVTAARLLMQLKKTPALTAYAKLLPLLDPQDIALEDIKDSEHLSTLFFSLEPNFDPLEFKPISEHWAKSFVDWLAQRILQDHSFKLDANLQALMGLYLPLSVPLDGLHQTLSTLTSKRSKARAQVLSDALSELETYFNVRRSTEAVIAVR